MASKVWLITGQTLCSSLVGHLTDSSILKGHLLALVAVLYLLYLSAVTELLQLLEP